MPRKAMARVGGESVTRKKKPAMEPADIAVQTLKKATPLELRNALKQLGVGTKYFTCYMCGEIKTKDEMFKSSDPRITTGVTRICRDCARKIVYSEDAFGARKPHTKQSVCEALEYIDKPYIANVYDTAEMMLGQQKARKKLADFWTNYTQGLNQFGKYDGMRWRDSDILQRTYAALDMGQSDALVEASPDKKQSVEEKDADVDISKEAKERYEINKADTIRFCGYDPFIDYKEEKDKPRLYAQIVSFLSADDSARSGMKINSVIQVVKALNQAETLNTQIDDLLTDKKDAMSNQALISRMMQTKKNCLDSALSIAKDNGISVNFDKSNSAGSQTLSGRMAKLEAEGLESEKINTFDIGTCAGMKQVAEISEATRHKQIGYDENIATEIKDIKVQLVEKLTKERDAANERARLLLRENMDLKQWMQDQGLLDANGDLIGGV